MYSKVRWNKGRIILVHAANIMLSLRLKELVVKKDSETRSLSIFGKDCASFRMFIILWVVVSVFAMK